MQKLHEVSLEAYLTAGNPFDAVSRPEMCERCKAEGSFHRHGTYERYVEELRVKVARFACTVCRLTVSLLPAFVLPYRNRLLEKVNRYFLGTEEERLGMSFGELLHRYWRRWEGYWERLQRQTGWPPPRPLAREPKGYWEQMGVAAGSMDAAQRHLIGGYGLSLLGRYLCHQVPARAEC